MAIASGPSAGGRVQGRALAPCEPHCPPQPPLPVEHDQPPVARAHVHVAGGVDRGRGADRVQRVVAPAQRARGRVERVDGAVGAGHDDGAVGQLRRAGIDVVARGVGPHLAAVGGIVGVHVAVEAAGDGQAALGQQRAGDHAAVDLGVPLLGQVGGAEPEHVRRAAEEVVVAGDHAPGGHVDRGQRPGLVARVEARALLPAVAVDGVDAEVVVGCDQRAVALDGHVALEPVDERAGGIGRRGGERPHGGPGARVARTGARRRSRSRRGRRRRAARRSR